jgi:hypothetical protein
MASGLRCAASTGRIHGCTDQQSKTAKTLAKPEPSIHGPSRGFKFKVDNARPPRKQIAVLAHGTHCLRYTA